MYRPLTIEAFGQQLLASGDLDPLYIAAADSRLPQPQLARWLLAYWCCYHAGASAWISEREGDGYWESLSAMAANVKCPNGGRWPRGRERRHFRGVRAEAAVAGISGRFDSPEAVVSWLSEHQGPYVNLRRAVTTLPLFGDWIAFKIGDMLERLCGVGVDFSDADLLMFSQPRAAAVLWWSEQHDTDPIDEAEAVRAAVGYLTQHFRDWQAPPRQDRRVGLQEVETILCKWKSHKGGHYPLGNDIDELRHGLHEWAPLSATAQRLLETMPSPVGRFF